MLRHQHEENLFHLFFLQSITYNFLTKKVEMMQRQSVKYHLMHKKDTIESHRSINLSSIQFMCLLGVDPVPRAYHMTTTERALWLAVFLSGNDQPCVQGIYNLCLTWKWTSLWTSMLWSNDSCQKGNPLTSVTWLYSGNSLRWRVF